MLRLADIAWLCVVTAAVIFFLVAFSVIDAGAITWAGFGLFAAGVALFDVPRWPRPRPPAP